MSRQNECKADLFPEGRHFMCTGEGTETMEHADDPFGSEVLVCEECHAHIRMSRFAARFLATVNR